MTLGAALNSTLSALKANQTILTNIAANVANANTQGYSAQEAILTTRVVGSQALGVSVGEITRRVDEIISDQIKAQSSTSGKTNVIKEYMEKMMFLFGQPGSGNDINSRLGGFFDNLSSLAASPSDFTTQALLVDSAVNLSSSISEIANELIDLQFEVELQIDKTIDNINSLINQIKTLNGSINVANAQGQNANALLDQRDAVINELSGLLNISVQEDDNGLVSIFVSTGSSQFTLLNSAGGNVQLAYTPAASEGTFTTGGTLNAIQVQFLNNAGEVVLSQNLVESGTVGNISTSFSGELGGLLDLRDEEIPEMLELLNEITTEMIYHFNKVHNDGVGIPPPTTLTGTYASDTDTAISNFSGSTMFALLENDGSPITSPWSHLTTSDDGDILFPPLTVNWDDIISADGSNSITPEIVAKEFNEYYNEIENMASIGPLATLQLRGSSATGSGPITSAEFNLEGMNISGGAATIVVNGITVAGGGGGETVDALPSALTSGFTVAAGERSFEPTTFTVNFDGSNTHSISVDVTVTDADGNTYDTTLTFSFDPTQDNSNVRSERYPPASGSGEDETIISPSPLTSLANMSFVSSAGSAIASGATGYMKITVNGSAGRGVAIDELDGAIGSTNPKGVSHYFGLNDFFVEARVTSDNTNPNQALSLAVRSDIVSDPSKFSRGQLQLSQQPSDSSSNPLYTYEVGAGNSLAVQSYVDMFLSQQSFSAAGSFPSITTTFSAYAGSITELMALKTNTAKKNDDQQAIIFDGLIKQQSGVSGVNVDEELANMLLYQNGYSASARIIRVVDELLQTLLDI